MQKLKRFSLWSRLGLAGHVPLFPSSFLFLCLPQAYPSLLFSRSLVFVAEESLMPSGIESSNLFDLDPPATHTDSVVIAAQQQCRCAQ